MSKSKYVMPPGVRLRANQDGPFRCVDADWKFCPPEGCPKWYGCARKQGWKLGDPSPPECTGKALPPTPPRPEMMEIQSVK